MKWLVLFYATFYSTSFAGGMVSSGGELLKNSRNPWWVKNTTHVQYCIEIDQSSISATPEKIDAMVRRALEYWKLEFSTPVLLPLNSDRINSFWNSIGVGTQTFTKVACTGAEHLRFKFGYEKLTQQEIAEIPDLKSHVSVALRTSYDDVTLTGKGIIYVASDKGPHAFDGGGESIVQPWRHEVLLFYTLAHELGHVFGLPHIGEPYTLMSEGFMEIILHKGFEPFIKDFPMSEATMTPAFFHPAKHFVQCDPLGFSTLAQNFFKLPADQKCLYFQIDGPNKQILIYSAQDIEFKNKTYVGVMRNLELESATTLGIMLYLTEKQTVFDPLKVLSRFPGPMFVGMAGSGEYAPAVGKPQPIYLKLNPTTFDITGIDRGSLKSVLHGNTETIPRL